MEISNRSVVLLCITAVAVAYILRSGPSTTVQTPPADAAPVVASDTSGTTTHARREPLDSDFRMIDQSMPVTGGQLIEGKVQPIQAPAEDVADQTQDTTADDPLADLYPEDQAQTDTYVAPRASRENSAAWAYDAPNDRSGDLTDREMFDRMLGFMDDDQRSQFRIVWTAMDPTERDRFLDEMRGNPNQGR
ncbi:MAG: hypothetical protein P4L46_22190 [Fimbriimonas sp.]|nr:hypothetical protein [Fimbriimonas sp.]